MTNKNITVVSTIVVLFLMFLGCGSNITTTTGGDVNGGTIVGGKGNEVEINYYEYQKTDSLLLKRTESFADSMLRSIRRMESKLSVLNNNQPSKREERVIKNTLKEKKAKRDSAIVQSNKYRERMRLRAIVQQEYLKDKRKRDSLNGKFKSDTVSQIKLGKILRSSTEPNDDGNTSPKAEQIFLSDYHHYEDLSNSILDSNLREIKDSISLLNSEIIPVSEQWKVLQNSLNYAIKTGNTRSQQLIKRDLAPINEKRQVLWKHLSELKIEEDYNRYLKERKSMPTFDKSKREKTRIFPTNGKELLQAFIDDAVIVLNNLEYNISPDMVKGVANSKIVFNEDGLYEVINLRNVQIIGAGDEPAHIYSNILNAPVLTFRNSSGVELKNLKLGHDGYIKTADVGCGLDGDVISLNNSYFFNMEQVELYGCGTQGLDLYNSGDITLKNSKVYDCTNGAVSIQNSFNLMIEDCIITDNRMDWRSLIDISASKNIYINNCEILKNQVAMGSQSNNLSIFSNSSHRANLFVENTIIEDNLVDFLATKRGALNASGLSLGLSNNYRVGTFKEQ